MPTWFFISSCALHALCRSGPGCSPVGIGAFREGVGPFAFTQYDGPALRNITDVRLVRSPARLALLAVLRAAACSASVPAVVAAGSLAMGLLDAHMCRLPFLLKCWQGAGVHSGHWCAT